MTARRAEAAAALAAALIAAVLVMVATAPHGPRVSLDSVLYLSAAESVRAGDGIVTFDGEPLTTLPPGLSVVIAAIGGIAGSDVLGVRILNALCMALIVLAGWLLLRRHVASPALRVAGLAGLASGSALFYVSTAAWSEPLFIVLTLATILALETELARPGGRRWIVGAGLLAGAAFAVRYSGMWLMATGAAVLLVADRRALPGRDALRRTVLFAAAAAILPVAVVLRNLVHTDGWFFGGRPPSETSLGAAVSETADAVWRLVVPADETLLLAWLPAAALAAVVVLVAARWGGGARGAAGRRAPIWPLSLVAGGYIVYLVASEITTELDPLGPRLLSPAFVPLLVLALAGLDRLFARPLPGRALVAAVAAAVVVTWLGGQFQVVRDEYDVRRAGAGYNEPAFRNSALVALIGRRDVTPTFSNHTDLLWFRTSIRAACWPSLVPAHCDLAPPDLDRIPAGRPALLAWFAEPEHDAPLVPAAVRPRVRLTLVERVADGGLYRVARP